GSNRSRKPAPSDSRRQGNLPAGARACDDRVPQCARGSFLRFLDGSSLRCRRPDGAGRDMGRTLTIVAQSQDARLDSNVEGDAAIQTAMDKLRALVHPPEYTLRRAASISDLAAALRADRQAYPNTPPELIQIIGHGAPGVLSLGAIWAHDRQHAAVAD